MVKRLPVAFRINVIANAINRKRIRTHVLRLLLVAVSFLVLLVLDRIQWVARVRWQGRAEVIRLQRYESEGLSPADAFAEKLARYVAWHSKAPDNATVLQWSPRAYDALGIRGVLHAFVVAVETWRYFEILAPPSAVFVPAAVLWNATRGAQGVPVAPEWFATLYDVRGIRACYGRRHAVHLMSHSLVHYEQLLNSNWYGAHCPSYLERCQEGGAYNLAVLRLAHNALLSHRPAVLARAQEMARVAHLQAGRYVAIHAHIGDDTERAHQKRSDESIRRLLRCASRAAAGSNHPPVVALYVASEDPAFRQRVAMLSSEYESLHRLRVVESAVVPHHVGMGHGFAAVVQHSVQDTAAEAVVLGRARALVSWDSDLSVYAALTGSARLLTPKQCELLG